MEDTHERPHYFGAREQLYARLQLEAVHERQLAFAMKAHPRLGASSNLLLLDDDVKRLVLQKMRPSPHVPIQWYPPIPTELNATQIYSRDTCHEHGESLRMLRIHGVTTQVHLRLHHPHLGITLFDSLLTGRFQYVSPPALGTEAQLDIYMYIDKDSNKIIISASRISDHGKSVTLCFHHTVLSTSNEYTNNALPDSGELALQITRTRRQ